MWEREMLVFAKQPNCKGLVFLVYVYFQIHCSLKTISSSNIVICNPSCSLFECSELVNHCIQTVIIVILDLRLVLAFMCRELIRLSHCHFPTPLHLGHNPKGALQGS